MKRIFMLTTAVMGFITLAAQQKQGRVIYERISQVPARSFSINGMTQEIPASERKDKFELDFGNNKSLWKQADPDNEMESMTTGSEGTGIVFKSVVAGSNDIVYYDFDAAQRIDKREMFDRTFIIEDSIRPLKWKVTGETKMILDQPCMKAVTTKITTQMERILTDGKVESKEVIDTAEIVAWFTSNITVSAGPAEYQGQLPGLILEMNISNGKQVYRALEIQDKTNLTAIKAPTGKKRYTQQEFAKERDKMLKEMSANGGSQRFIMRN